MAATFLIGTASQLYQRLRNGSSAIMLAAGRGLTSAALPFLIGAMPPRQGASFRPIKLGEVLLRIFVEVSQTFFAAQLNFLAVADEPVSRAAFQWFAGYQAFA